MFRWIVNFGLLAIPIGTTIGVLVGIESHRHATGQAPLFGGNTGSDSGGGGGTGSGSGGGSGSNNGITKTEYCQKSYGISPPSNGQQYILNPNQWGWTEGQPGALCMNVTAFNNHTYPTNTTAPEFSVTWQYPPGPETQPVHAFPNIQVESSTLPVTLQSLQHVNLDVHWTYGVGNETAASTDVQALTADLVNANVALDMFLDSDQTNAQNSTTAKHEVMVWLADFGAAAQPLGLAQGVVATQVLNGTTFNLYYGQNSLQQNVLTWLASVTTETFTGDIAPLITQLTSMNKATFPTMSDFLGYMSLGSEAFSANNNVTFYVPTLSIDIQA